MNIYGWKSWIFYALRQYNFAVGWSGNVTEHSAHCIESMQTHEYRVATVREHAANVIESGMKRCRETPILYPNGRDPKSFAYVLAHCGGCVRRPVVRRAQLYDCRWPYVCDSVDGSGYARSHRAHSWQHNVDGIEMRWQNKDRGFSICCLFCLAHVARFFPAFAEPKPVEHTKNAEHPRLACK